MSDHEFENYLTLLASLLRLDQSQQGAIAEELRTHLEDRLEDLVARGVPRHEAVRQALAEFGDAAGLAAEFASLSRNRKRRWLMRTVSFSVAAMVLIAVGLLTFWPGHNAGPGAAQVVAQAPADAPKDKPAADKAAAGPKEPTIADKLNQRINAEFVETPLQDVVQFLSETSGIQMYVNRKRLEDFGTALDSPVSKSLKQVKLSTILDLTLGELGLVYVEKDDLLVITTQEDADATMEVRVYDCRDLFAMPAPAIGRPAVGTEAKEAVADEEPAGGEESGTSDENHLPLPTPHEQRAERLMSIITTAVEPQTWAEIGGLGTISEYNGLIVVNQSARTHAKIEKVLDMLRQAAAKPVGSGVVR